MAYKPAQTNIEIIDLVTLIGSSALLVSGLIARGIDRYRSPCNSIIRNEPSQGRSDAYIIRGDLGSITADLCNRYIGSSGIEYYTGDICSGHPHSLFELARYKDGKHQKKSN